MTQCGRWKNSTSMRKSNEHEPIRRISSCSVIPRCSLQSANPPTIEIISAVQEQGREVTKFMRIAVAILAFTLQACAQTIPAKYLDPERYLDEPAPSLPSPVDGSEPFPNSEMDAIPYYFGDRRLDPVEGIWTWDNNTYQIAIIKNNSGVEMQYDYVGIVIRADLGAWKAGQMKLLLNSTAETDFFTGVYFNVRQSRSNTQFTMNQANSITVKETNFHGASTLIRDYPIGNRRPSVAKQGTESHGTCFAVSPNGSVITSHHVIDGASSIAVTLADGKTITAVVESSSPANDIAALRLAASTPEYLSFTSTKSVKLGDQVFTIGYPLKSILGSDAKFTEGSISALTGFQGEVAYMQISVPVQPGNSGGPLVNNRGDVVGMIAATAAVQAFYQATGSLPQNVNWAVKSDYIQPMIDEASLRTPAANRGEAISRVQKAVCQVIALY